MKAKKGIKIGTIILIAACFIGLSLLLYPYFSDYWNKNHTTRMVTDYTNAFQNIEEEDYLAIWKEAIDFNSEIREMPVGSHLPYTMMERYNKCLSIDDSLCMGYIEIPKLDITLMISHGTSDSVLESGVGHLEWSSLPTGGVSTHCILSGHRGLPTAKLFTDLDQIREGDVFLLNILNETLTYEVDQIRVVEPTEIGSLRIVEGKDYCTLVTCTPYGINTHRLLVRGHRIENEKAAVHFTSEAVIVDQLIVAMFLAIPILFLLLMAVMLKKPESKKRPQLPFTYEPEK